ncbi:hypothetical protein GTA08_BOTSDO08851 [Neofusicoccum parvum]|nr:hypothetical protein GTA08_BOTSDO08851 [Neofusicoccum parvum]
MTRKKPRPWLEKGRANRLAGTPGAGKANTKLAQQKPPQKAQQQPPKKKQKPAPPVSAIAPPADDPHRASSSPQTQAQTQSSQPPPHQQQQQQPPATIPFDPNERILLIGDGDLSYARSIIEHHGCADVLATTHDDRATLEAKYPQAVANIAYIEGEGQRVASGVDATRLAAHREVRKGAAGPGLVEEDRGGWDRIVFNFPHVGGKSTDVNRQVRYNQELLVSFFTAALPLLSPTPNPDSAVSPNPTIVVTLFEGEPYTLWNVRDLARHVGLKVQRSFRFRADAYPGYRHARTLGNVEGVNGGAWRGEERSARTFVFEAGDGAAAGGKRQGKGGDGGRKKRKKGGESDSDDD